MSKSILAVVLAGFLVACGSSTGQTIQAGQTQTVVFERAVGTAVAAGIGTAIAETAAAQPTSTLSLDMILPTLEPSATPPPPPFTFEVFANQPWQETGAYVRVNDFLQIDYTGGQWTSQAGQDYTGPANAPLPRERDYGCAPMANSMVGRHALVGKIGDGGPFKVGGQFIGTVTDEGPLFLQMNDCNEYRADNDGSVTVSIRVSR